MTFLEIPKHLLPAKSSRSFRPLTPHRDWLRALSVSVDEQPASYPFRGPKTRSLQVRDTRGLLHRDAKRNIVNHRATPASLPI